MHVKWLANMIILISLNIYTKNLDLQKDFNDEYGRTLARPNGRVITYLRNEFGLTK